MITENNNVTVVTYLDAPGWPKGKKRNSPGISPAKLAHLLEYLRLVPKKVMSRRAMSRIVDVDDRTLRRWLSGEDVPSAHHVAILGQLKIKCRNIAKAINAGPQLLRAPREAKEQ